MYTYSYGDYPNTGSWANASDWTSSSGSSPAGPPGSGDTALIHSTVGYTNGGPAITLSSDVTIAGLTITGNCRVDLYGGHNLYVTNGFELDTNVCLFSYAGGGVVTVNANVALAGGILGWPDPSFAYVGVGNVTATSATSTLSYVSDTGSLTVNSGAILQLGDPVAASSTQTVSTFSGGATINSGGTLTSGVAGSSLTLGSSLSVSGTLGGTLTINAPVTDTSTGIISPGKGGNGSGHTAGIVTLGGTSALTLVSGSALNFSLGANTTPGTTYDQIDVGGTVSLGGATVNLYRMGTPTAGTYTLMNYGTTSSPGTLAIAANQIPGWSYTSSITSTSVSLTLSASSPSAYTLATGPAGDYTWTTAGWTGGPWYPGAVPTDTASVGLPGGTIAQGNYSELDLNSSVTIASLSLTSTGRIALGNLGGGMLTVTNPITLGPNQEIYTYQYQSPVLTAPITLTGGYLGYPIYPYGLVDTGNVTASSGTSTLNVVNITGTLTINSGATVQISDPNHSDPSAPSAATAAFSGGTTVNTGGTLTSSVAGSCADRPGLAGGRHALWQYHLQRRGHRDQRHDQRRHVQRRPDALAGKRQRPQYQHHPRADQRDGRKRRHAPGHGHD